MKTVNFIEAVNSGATFRSLECEDDYWYDDLKDFFRIHYTKNGKLEAQVFAEISGQFEIEEKTITITKGQLEEAVNMMLASTGFDAITYNLSKQLGFK